MLPRNIILLYKKVCIYTGHGGNTVAVCTTLKREKEGKMEYVFLGNEKRRKKSGF